MIMYPLYIDYNISTKMADIIKLRMVWNTLWIYILFDILCISHKLNCSKQFGGKTPLFDVVTVVASLSVMMYVDID